MSNAIDLFYINFPPEKTSLYQVQNTATNTSAASFDWTTGLAGLGLLGKCWLTLEALTNDCYVRFGPTSTTATTANNGRIIKAGQPGIAFYVSPKQHKFIDHLGTTGAGVLKVQVSSPIGERVDI